VAKRWLCSFLRAVQLIFGATRRDQPSGYPPPMAAHGRDCPSAGNADSGDSIRNALSD
jgi:hypothetical protein